MRSRRLQFFSISISKSRNLLNVLKQVTRSLLTLLILGLFLATQATADTSSTDGTTPPVLTPGAPGGSYALSGFDNINLFNGNLNFGLPLLQVSGRGEAQYTVMLPIENHWRVIDRSNDYQEIWNPTDSTWYGDKPGYGPGVLLGRAAATDSSGSGPACVHYPSYSYLSLTRLTFILPDGTEYEFRDQATGGQVQTSNCFANGYNRGTVFVTADGSAATFVSDTPIYDVPGSATTPPSGYLSLRNGLRYRINGGRVSWLRDRNGNKLSFTYGDPIYGRLSSIADSLNRQINISYANFQTVFYDQITFKGFGGAQRTIRINYSQLHNVLRTNRPGDLSSVQTLLSLFPELTGPSNNQLSDPYRVSTVVLPDGIQQFQFSYNVYGELARVVLPTGGMFEYEFNGASPDGNPDGVYGGSDPQIYRRVSEKRVYRDANTQENKTLFGGTNGTTAGTVDTLDPTGTVLFSREKHYFYGSPPDGSSVGIAPFDYPTWNSGKEYQTEIIDTANCTPSTCATVLRRTVNVWQQGCTVSSWSSAIANNPRVVETDTTLADTNQVTKQTFSYDCFNNKTDTYEYDFGTGAAGALMRHTHTDYITATNYTNAVNGAHLRSLPSQVSVYDAVGVGVERARATFEYDNYTADSNHAALLPRTSISGLDPAFTTAYLARGNVTGTTPYLLTNGAVTGSISAYAQYDVAGNVVKSIDARGCATTSNFSDVFGAPDGDARQNSSSIELNSVGQYSYAFVTSATNCLGQTTYSQFDYYLGRPVDAEDANGVVSSGYSENDPLDRPTKTIRNANQSSSFKSQTLFTYEDANRTMTTTSDFATYGDGVLVSKVFYDGLGRTTEARQYEGGSNYIAVQTQYDAVGRAFKVSNPFRPWQSETAVWTTSAFDALSRVISVTTPDGSVATSSYSGNSVTATDQNGKQRKNASDALGRVTQVYEDPAGLSYLTSYSYDVLNDLVTVNQGSQTRTFAYDSLKRLLSTTNPENGTVSYQYDNNGNALVKTDARGVSSHYAYDELNRPTRRWYNGSSSLSATTNNSPALPSGVGASDEIKYFYDSQNLPTGAPSFSRGPSVGRLVAVAYGTNSSAGDYYGYDAIGRPAVKIQQTGAINYQVSAAYNVAGALTSETYPSGRAVNYSYDGAGRASSVTGNLGDGTNRTYSTGIIYSSLGGMAKEQFGTTTPIYNKLFYNSRGQLSEIRESTSYTWAGDTSWNRGAIINHYSFQCWGACNGTDNNGNLKKQEVYVPDNDQVTSYKTWYQQYTYDSLNRLTQVNEYTGNPSLDWQQKYTIDRYGNRTIDVNNTSANIPRPSFNVDASTNRLTVPNGQSGTMSYDSAGNLITDSYTGSGSRTYDAQNRMTGAQGTPWSYYTYDGAGQRVRRNVNGQEFWQIYGLGSELLAEYAANAAPAAPQKEYGYRNGQLLITAEAQRTNFALASNGAVATAQNYTVEGTYWNLHFQPTYAIDGVHSINPPNGDHYWRDEHGLSSWLEVDFHGSTTIDEIDVYTTADNPAYYNEPTPTQTFTSFGITSFDVQYWNGAGWTTLPGGSVSNNNLVWRKFNFAAITTTKVRVVVNGAVDGVARINELEAWGNGAGRSTNVAAASNGGTTSAQNYTPDSAYPGLHFQPSYANDGVRYANPPYGDQYWRDEHGLSSWVEVDFSGSQTIDAIDVFTMADYPAFLAYPATTQQFNAWGATSYDVQYWNGSSWVTVPGGSVTNNNLIWRRISFSAIATSKIRVVVNSAVDGVARIVEVEAWTPVQTGSTANIHWLVTDQLGTPRMIFDQSGSLANTSHHDYLPFGEELSAGQGLRTAQQGYTINDNVRQHFTGYEADGESGLNFAHARYQSSAQGRFTSADPFRASMTVVDPQSFNRYTYVVNNPVNLTDPTGLANSHGDSRYPWEEDPFGDIPWTVAGDRPPQPDS
jgi:RHS repeat-associated protein